MLGGPITLRLLNICVSALDERFYETLKNLDILVNQMADARKDVKEAFVVLSEPKDGRAQFQLEDHRGRPLSSDAIITSMFSQTELDLLQPNIPLPGDLERLAHLPDSST